MQLPISPVVTLLTIEFTSLKIHPEAHKSVDEIEQQGVSLRKQFEQAGLDVPVLNSYVAAEDFESVDRLINCGHQLGAQKIRLVLPKTLV